MGHRQFGVVCARQSELKIARLSVPKNTSVNVGPLNVTICRLCGEEAQRAFSLPFFKRFDVSFYRCSGCKSLQTEEPHWLGETYSGSLPGEDLGAVARCQRAQVTVFYLSRMLQLGRTAKVLDFGGGNGLLVRMLRDIGIDARLSDKYSQNTYAAGFEDEVSQSYDIILATEVFEHLPNPIDDLREIFKRDPKILFATTILYEGQDKNWSYLCPNSGGHVFFYSEAALEHIGRHFGYNVVWRSPNIVFSKAKIGYFQRIFIRRVLFGGKPRKLLNMLFPMLGGQSLQPQDDAYMRNTGMTRN
ncbi:hypothetical protein ACSSVY_004632 [Roseovarius sp. MBR-51]